MSYVQPGLGSVGRWMSAGGSAQSSGYPVQAAGGSAHSSGHPVQATIFGHRSMPPYQEIKDKNDSPNTQGESSHSSSDLCSSDVRIDIDESTHPSSQRLFSMSLAASLLDQQDQVELSKTGRDIHQNVDKDLKERARQALSENGGLLQKMSDTYKDDKELVLAAVEQDPRAFRHASYRLKGDPDIVAIVVKDHVYLLLEHQTRREIGRAHV